MKLGDALKTSLNELRMQMLGANVLFGFEFKGLFEDAFGELSSGARAVCAAALLLMVAVLALLIAPPCQHRIVEEGEATERIQRTATAFAKVALLPLAGAIGCDVYVAAVRAFGGTLGAAAASSSLGLALLLWFGLGWGLRRQGAGQEKHDGKGSYASFRKVRPHAHRGAARPSRSAPRDGALHDIADCASGRSPAHVRRTR